MVAGSSPGTSEMASVSAAAGQAASASRPPLIAERCLRTALISPMAAPEASSARRQALLVGQRDAGRRQRQQRRATARKQHQRQIALFQAGDEGQHALGGGRTGPVGHGMGRLHQRDPPQRHAMAIGHRHQARKLAAPVPFQLGGHGGGGLAGTHRHGAAGRDGRQMGGDAPRCGAGRNRAGEQRFQELARVHRRRLCHGGGGGGKAPARPAGRA